MSKKDWKQLGEDKAEKMQNFLLHRLLPLSYTHVYSTKSGTLSSGFGNLACDVLGTYKEIEKIELQITLWRGIMRLFIKMILRVYRYANILFIAYCICRKISETGVLHHCFGNSLRCIPLLFHLTDSRNAYMGSSLAKSSLRQSKLKMSLMFREAGAGMQQGEE
jgi:hypothetical protein